MERLLQVDGLEPELQEPRPRLVIRRRGLIDINDAWWIALSFLPILLCVAAEGAYRILRHDIWQVDEPSTLVGRALVIVACLVGYPVFLLYWRALCQGRPGESRAQGFQTPTISGLWGIQTPKKSPVGAVDLRIQSLSLEAV